MKSIFFSTNAALNEIANVYGACPVLTEAITVQQLMQSRSISEPVARAIIAMDATPSKSDALQLAKFYLEIQYNEQQPLDELGRIYREFATLRQHRQINAQINAFKTFAEFQSQVRARAGARKLKQSTAVHLQHLKPDYEDEYIAAYEANTPAEACELGKGYSFCISKQDMRNSFYTYKGSIGDYTKPGDVATGTWFIQLKKRLNGSLVSSEKNNVGEWVNPEHLIVIHYDANNDMRWTWADNGAQQHGTEEITKQRMLQMFPEFAPLFGAKNYKGIAAGKFTSEEIDTVHLLKLLSSSASAFNDATNVQKEMYIKNKRAIPFFKETYGLLNGALRNELFKCMNTITVDAWNIISDADKIKIAKIALQPNVHARDQEANVKLIECLLALNIQS